MPTGGMMMPSTRDVTILPNAAPMMTPTARSMTLPRAMKSRNSLSMSLLRHSDLPTLHLHLDPKFDDALGRQAKKLRRAQRVTGHEHIKLFSPHGHARPL